MPKVVITLPAYRAELTVEQTVADIPHGIADELILVDDASPDDTVRVARGLGMVVYVHEQNRGYGGNQKTCYTEALRHGADIIVLLHPDYQYDPKAVPLLIAPIVAGDADMTFGSRFAGLGDPLSGGMPMYRVIGNRATTIMENLMLGSRFTDMHSGMRAYTRRCLLSLPFLGYSDDFWFDSQMLVDAVTLGQRVVEVPIPTRYTIESSSIAIVPSLRYIGESLLYCAKRSAARGKRGRRSPVARRLAQSRKSPVPATPSPSEGCAVCGANTDVFADGQNIRCRRCDLLSLGGAITPGSISRSEKDQLRHVTFDHVLNAISEFLVPGNRLLDIGAGTGRFLAQAEMRGWKATGIESSATAVAIARERFHVEMEHATVDSFLLEGSPADVITALNVLESAPEPVAVLRRLRTMMQSEGLLVVGIGLERAFGNHLHAFGPVSLARALDLGGFRLIDYRPVARNSGEALVEGFMKRSTERRAALAIARPV